MTIVFFDDFDDGDVDGWMTSKNQTDFVWGVTDDSRSGSHALFGRSPDGSSSNGTITTSSTYTDFDHAEAWLAHESTAISDANVSLSLQCPDNDAFAGVWLDTYGDSPLVISQNESGTRASDDTLSRVDGDGWLRLSIDLTDSDVTVEFAGYSATQSFGTDPRTLDWELNVQVATWSSATGYNELRIDDVRFTELNIVDDFETGDLPNWTNTDSNWSIDSSIVYEGANSLKFDEGMGPSWTAEYTGDGPRPALGSTLEWYHYWDGNSNGGSYAFFAGTFVDGSWHQGYRVGTNLKNGSMVLSRWDDGPGSATDLATGTASNTKSGEWVRNQVEWRLDDTLVYTLYRASDNSKLGQIQASDGTYSDQRGLGLSAHGDTWTDYIRTTEWMQGPRTLQMVGHSDTQIDLAWDTPTSVGDESVQEYVIYRDTNVGAMTSDYSEIDRVPAGKTTYTDTGLDEGTRYHYRTTAVVEVDQQ